MRGLRRTTTANDNELEEITTARIIIDESTPRVPPLQQTYKMCFVGKDAAKWLMEKSGRASSAEEAEALGNLLMGGYSTEWSRRLLLLGTRPAL